MNDQLNLIFENFHFLRPEWFYALAPIVFLFVILKLRQGKGSSWENAIDATLLPYLLDNESGKVSKNPLFLIPVVWVLATIALAGPVWEKTPQPVHEREDALVIIFDLTRSMYSIDVKPNRLVRARRKMLDLLSMREEGVTALIVYSGDAHIVSPLTDDAKTISEMIPAITPEIMPSAGSQLTPALHLAKKLFEDAGMTSGRILIVTDEIRDIAQAQTVARQNRYNYPVSVLAVGTAEGAPILSGTPGSEGAYLKSGDGTLVIPKVNFAALKDFASVSGGRYAQISLVDTDLTYLLAEQPLVNPDQFRELERDFDVWYEEGPWLLLLILPLAALSFRKGWLWSIAFVVLLPMPRAEASIWDDLWESRDQQAIAAFKKGDAALAAELFEHKDWKGSALYKGDDFLAAADNFARSDSATSQYNLGNAMAKQGLYEEAIEAYDAALSTNPDDDDAKFNRQLVSDLLEQQEQQEQQQDGEDQDQESEDSEEEQDSDSQDSQDSQDSENQQSGDESDSDEASEEEAESQDEAEQQEQQEQEAADQQPSEAEPEPLDEEEQQALQQWLRRVPDDPGGLLRRKFQMQHDDRIKQGGRSQNDPSNW